MALLFITLDLITPSVKHHVCFTLCYAIDAVDSVLYADPQSHIKSFGSLEERQQALEGT